MRICKNEMRMGALSIAVSSALAVMFAAPMSAYAEETWEDEVAIIRHPTNYIEVGAENVSKDSAKFGEYNGLDKKGGKAIANISVRGGDAYEGGDGTMRWSLTGRDLGTTSRELGAAVGNQGRWNLNIGYDELRHNITDTYQTPLQGSMGGNVFTLPANFGTFVAQTAPSARTLDITSPNQLSAFHTEDVGTTRKNTSLGAGIILSPELSLKFDYNHLAQSGAKLMAGAALGGQLPTGGTGTWRAEAVAILMNPTNYNTDTFNLALNWKGEQGHLSGGYFGSFFKDGYDRLSYQNPMLSTGGTAPAGVYQTNTLSTAPDNQLHQLNVSGGYAFSPTTKLVGGISYGRNTQNASFLTGVPELVTTPQSSLNGVVVTKHFDLKLSNQTTRELMLGAALKYNERDNRTVSDTYLYRQLGNATYTGVNTPYSNKKTQLELAADYRLAVGQSLRLAYEREAIRRWCDKVADGYQCVASPASNEGKLGLGYRMKASDSVRFNVGYAYANRKGDFDSAYVANTGNRAHVTAPPTGSTVIVPSATYGNGVLNGGNFLGFAAQPYASRKQDILTAGVNWQASDKLDVDLSGRFSRDKYDSELGVQNGRTSSINLGATYTYNDENSVSAYATMKNSERELKMGATSTAAAGTGNTWAYAGVAATNFWTNQLKENSNTIGLNSKHTGLMGSKLELASDLSYSLDKSRYATQVPYLATCSAVGTLTCGDLPDIKNKVITLRLSGIYALDQASKVSVGYMYQQLKSEDYFYNWYQYGYTGLRGMPTNQTSGSYNVNVVSASYIYSFK